MKYMIMCEGNDEVEIMNVLLENDMLVIAFNDLVGITVYHSRQIDQTPQVQIALNIHRDGSYGLEQAGDKKSD